MEFGSLEPGAIISYHRMCTEEHEVRLQRGMNFRLDPRYSVVLMNRREAGPYADGVEDDGATLIYEGHDAPRQRSGPDPAGIDQPLEYASGRPTQNKLFRDAALAHRDGEAAAEPVKVYEKLRRGIWVYNGVFRLTDCRTEQSGGRSVFKFRLDLADADALAEPSLRERSRMIPSAVKLAVWERDGGRCVICGRGRRAPLRPRHPVLGGRLLDHGGQRADPLRPPQPRRRATASSDLAAARTLRPAAQRLVEAGGEAVVAHPPQLAGQLRARLREDARLAQRGAREVGEHRQFEFAGRVAVTDGDHLLVEPLCLARPLASLAWRRGADAVAPLLRQRRPPAVALEQGARRTGRSTTGSRGPLPAA